MCFDIQVIGRTNAGTVVGGPCELIDQIAPNLPAVCIDTKALSQRVYEAVVLTGTIDVPARISAANHIGVALHQDNAGVISRLTTEVPS